MDSFWNAYVTWQEHTVKIHRTCNYSEHSSIIWPNVWVFVYELRGSGLESSCSHLSFRLCACFKQGVHWDSAKYRVWIHSETRMRHDKNIQSKYTLHISTQNTVQSLASSARSLSVRLQIKLFWVRVELQALKIQISCLFWAWSSLTFTKI